MTSATGTNPCSPTRTGWTYVATPAGMSPLVSAHQCLGQPLARVELQVVYGTLYRRVPSLRLAVDLDRIPFKHDGLVYGVYELPVTW
jgi:cytochrome P450